MRKPSSAGVAVRSSVVEIALGDIAVRVDSPVSEEGPVGAAGIDLVEIECDSQDLLTRAALYQQASTGVRNEAAAPELDSPGRGALVAHTVHGAHIHPVGNGMASL